MAFLMAMKLKWIMIIKKYKNWVASFLVVLSISMMGYGVYREEVDTMFEKAVAICLECIGIG